MKKVISIVLALMLMASLSATIFAANETGSITINGVGADTQYEIYKMLDLESYDVAAGAYSYKANAAWAEFFATDGAKAYVSTDADGYVTWKAAEDDDTKAAFAKLALAYAKANGISPVKSSKVDGDFVVTETMGKFTNLELGYYLVDSTMGALCGLTTTNPDASINAKNGIPTIDKQVKEDSTSQWSETNTADIGQIVEYRVTINVHAGAENYVLHDTMQDGMTFKEVTKIEHVVPGQNTHEASTDLYNVVSGDDLDDDCTFEVVFSKEFCDEMETNDKIVVYYNAVLNEKAVIAGAGTLNSAVLTFGEGGESGEDTVTTYTYAFDLVKTDSANKLIDGAEFRIYDALTGGNEVPVIQVLDENGDPALTSDGYHIYRRVADGETGADVIVVRGKVRVLGLDNGTYYLQETKAPDGYNILSARQKFIISDSNLDAVFNDGIYSTGSGVHVVNKTGSMLPETGGMGTVLFVTFGFIVVLGAGVVLVAKKRMAMIND